MSTPNGSIIEQRSNLRYPPSTGKILRGATAGAAAALFDLETLYYGAGTFSPQHRTFAIFRVWAAASLAPAPDAYYELGSVNTIAATVGASFPIQAGEAQEFLMVITSNHRYLSLIRAGANDISWALYLSDHIY